MCARPLNMELINRYLKWKKCCTMKCDYNMFTYLATNNYGREYLYNTDLGCLDHLFIHCSFTQSPWQWITSIIDTLLPHLGYFQMLWTTMSSKPFGSHLLIAWCMTIFLIFYHIWKTRNKLTFEDIKPSTYSHNWLL